MAIMLILIMTMIKGKNFGIVLHFGGSKGEIQDKWFDF